MCGAPARVPVRFEDHSGPAIGLQPQRCAHPGQSGTDDRHVDGVLNVCSEHAFRMPAGGQPVNAGFGNPPLGTMRECG